MTKSVQARLVLIMVILIVATMIIVGTVLVNRVSGFYNDDFEKQVSTFFDGDLINEIQTAADERNPEQIATVLEAHTGVLGIDSYRNYYVLSAEGEYLAGSSTVLGNQLQISDNIIRAMAGERGGEISSDGEFMDFALPISVEDKLEYIVYIKDTKEEIRDLNWVLISIIVETLFLGMFIAVALSFLLARTITNPIENITSGAAKIAGGDLSVKLKVGSKDEIGTLSETFNVMAGQLKNNLEEIEGERNKLRTIFLYLTDGVAAFDRDGILVTQNRAAEEMLGGRWAEGESSYSEVFAGAGISDTFEKARTLQGNKYIIAEQRIGDKDFRFHIAPFKLGDEKSSDTTGGVIVVINDITEQQRLEQSRREFIANVSHELRTPLTNIKSYSETVLEDEDIDRPTTEKFLKIVVGESDRMIRIVKDLMSLSRLDNNKVDFKFEPYSMPELIEKTKAAMTIEAQKRNQTLTSSVDDKLVTVIGDREKIEQVLINIVSNAIKYTPDGGRVDIDAALHRGSAYIKVSDTGVGIPKKDITKVFERFYRVDKARSREMGGTGLGLAIAKEIVEAHKGRIAITSRINEGTEVIIQLPVDPRES